MAKNFFEFINDINRTIQEAREKHTAATAQLEQARKNKDDATHKYKFGSDERLIADIQYRKAEEKYKRDVDDLQAEAETSCNALRKSLETHVRDFFTVNPGEIDANALALLNSGAMSDADLVALANKFSSNYTMLKLIAGQAEKRSDESRAARLLSVNIANYISPRNRLEIFDTAVNIAKRTIQSRSSLATAFQSSWDSEFFPNLRDAMAETESFHMDVV